MLVDGETMSFKTVGVALLDVARREEECVD